MTAADIATPHKKTTESSRTNIERAAHTEAARLTLALIGLKRGRADTKSNIDCNGVSKPDAASPISAGLMLKIKMSKSKYLFIRSASPLSRKQYTIKIASMCEVLANSLGRSPENCSGMSKKSFSVNTNVNPRFVYPWTNSFSFQTSPMPFY